MENYLARSITMSGMMNGTGDRNDNLRMLKCTGAKYLGRSICLWGDESRLLANFERACHEMPLVRTMLPDTI